MNTDANTLRRLLKEKTIRQISDETGLPVRKLIKIKRGKHLSIADHRKLYRYQKATWIRDKGLKVALVITSIFILCIDGIKKVFILLFKQLRKQINKRRSQQYRLL